MKKFILSLFLTLGIFMASNAQIATSSTNFMDNWYAGVGAGVATPLTFNKIFPVNPMGHLVLGKQFDPIFGAEIEGDVWFGSNSTQLFDANHNRITNRFDHPYAHNAIRGVGVGLFGTTNITNILYPYFNKPHKAELFVRGGVDYAHAYIPHRKDNNAFGIKTGAAVRFNLNDANALQVGADVLWKISNNGDQLQFNKNRAQLEPRVTFVHKFKTSNGTHNFKTYDIAYYEAKIKELENRRPPRPNVVEKTIVREIIHNTGNPFFVPFAFNSSELDNNSKDILDRLVKHIGENSIVNVFGYSSFEDSSNPEYNKILSEQRAKAVADYLSNKGVKINKLEGMGANTRTSQRCVIISLFK